MASASNSVIKGNYAGHLIRYNGLDVVITRVTYYRDSLKVNSHNELPLNTSNVKQYEVITEETWKSGSSAILRGALGASVLGPLGLFAGFSAKNKGIYLIAIEWKDGQKSLIEIDEKKYQVLMRRLYRF